MVKVIGMDFEEIREIELPKKRGVKILYQAPDSGPRFWVEHYRVVGGIPMAKKREDIRIAFSRITGGAAVIWRGDGYYTRASNSPVKWVPNIARFVPKSVEELEAENSPEILNEDDDPAEID